MRFAAILLLLASASAAELHTAAVVHAARAHRQRHGRVPRHHNSAGHKGCGARWGFAALRAAQGG